MEIAYDVADVARCVYIIELLDVASNYYMSINSISIIAFVY